MAIMCPHCHYANRDDAVRCGNCGILLRKKQKVREKLVEEEMADVTEEQFEREEKRRRIITSIFVGIGVLLLMVVIIYAFYVMFGKDKKVPSPQPESQVSIVQEISQESSQESSEPTLEDKVYGAYQSNDGKIYYLYADRKTNIPPTGISLEGLNNPDLFVSNWEIYGHQLLISYHFPDDMVQLYHEAGLGELVDTTQSGVFNDDYTSIQFGGMIFAHYNNDVITAPSSAYTLRPLEQIRKNTKPTYTESDKMSLDSYEVQNMFTAAKTYIDNYGDNPYYDNRYRFYEMVSAVKQTDGQKEYATIEIYVLEERLARLEFVDYASQTVLFRAESENTITSQVNPYSDTGTIQNILALSGLNRNYLSKMKFVFQKTKEGYTIYDTGIVSSQYTTPDPGPDISTYGTVILWGSGTNLRRAPSTSSEIVWTTDRLGVVVAYKGLVGEDGEWTQIEYNGNTCYVATRLTTVQLTRELQLNTEGIPYYDHPCPRPLGNIAPDIKTVSVIGYTSEDEGYFYIHYNGGYYYIQKKYVLSDGRYPFT